MKFFPRSYQITAAKHLLTCPQALLYLDLGLGKTVVSLSFLQYLKHNHLIKRSLIVAPLRPVYSVWPEEIEKWDHLKLSYTILHGPKKNDYLKKFSDLYLINYEGLRWLYWKYRQAKKFPFDCIIIDESSFVKNPSSKRFQYLRVFTQYTKYCILLTGSIAPTNLLNIWSQYFLLDQGKRLGPSYSRFRQENFLPIDYNQNKWVLQKGKRTQIASKVSDITLRMRNKDYLQLPEKIINNLKCELPPNLREQYDTLEQEFFLELENATIETFSAPALSMKLRQFLAGAVYSEKRQINFIHDIKIKVLQEIKEGYANSLLVAIQFRFEYDLIKAKFKDAPIIYGGVSAQESVDLINKWNQRKLSILIVHPQSIAHGINLQTGGSYILWMNLPWSAEQYQQLNGRLHRSGQTESVFINRIIFKNTLDEVIARALTRKMNDEQAFANELINDIKNYKKENKK